MKYCFIINGRAGKKTDIDALVKKIKSSCEKKSVEHDIFVSQSIESTDKYVADTAASTQGEVAFFGYGGDGTLCKTVGAVKKLDPEYKNRVFVGIIPAGTGNDFVNNFENKEAFFDIESQIDSTPIEIDLLKCNDVYSVNMINIGFDCHVVCKKEAIGRKKWLPRKFAYIFSLIITLVKKPGVTVKYSGESEEKKLLLTTFANGCFCGGGFLSNPNARLNDGLIDTIAVKNIGRLKFVSLVGKYKKGKHLDGTLDHIISHGKIEEINMVFSEETPVCVDGEVIYANELSLSVEKDALKFLVPKGAMTKNIVEREKVLS